MLHILRKIYSPFALMCAALFLTSGAFAASTTADHSKFKELEGPFKSGPEVTKACLSCHTEASKQVHKTTHWTWQFENEKTGQTVGKLNVVNNFCINPQSNQAGCTTCHVGYGWVDNTFDFTQEDKVDCLVCHDQTGIYDKKKLRGGKVSNLAKIAKNVGPTSRTSCGSCHFKGGGGKAVKHGDLDPSFDAPDTFVDVHMDADGLNFTCSTCHTTDAHMVSGSRYAGIGKDTTGMDYPGKKGDTTRATCVSCHDDDPHDNNAKLNDHTDKVACQTCHIPVFARGDYPTKSWWDWSQAGKMGEDGKPVSVLDKAGNEIYNSKKGDFKWDQDVIPEYRWYNGAVKYTLPGQKFEPKDVVEINKFQGSVNDPNALIWPIKLMKGKQPIDAENKSFVTLHTVGKDGFWKTFDWQKSIEIGMEKAGLPFSGKYDFIETEMSWPLAHMVAPAREALECEECHAKGGRLAAITDVYLPGRDANPWLDLGGFGLLGLTVAGVGIHGLLRIFLNRKA